MQRLILVKLGGSLITNKNIPFTENIDVISQLVKEISLAKHARKIHLIIGHGGGSYPHVPAKKYKTAQGVINKNSLEGISKVQDAASKLNRIVVKVFIESGENAFPLTPSSFIINQSGKIKKAFIDPLLATLNLNLLPIVYGDVVMDTKRGCSILSTEKILNYLSLALNKKYKVEKVIHCGITDGVLDNDGKTIPEISKNNFQSIKRVLNTSHGIDLTGGMLHKVEESLALADTGIPSVIINGERKKELLNELLGKKSHGTIISP